MDNWINKRSRIYWYDQYANNEQETAFARYDPDRIAEELVNTGADITVIYAANQFGIAYYPSKIWPQHPNLKGVDYVGDLMSRFRSKGKKILLYVNWLDSKHAEWNYLPLGQQNDPYYNEQPLVSWADPSVPNGRVQALRGGAWRYPCINSPHREDILAITREIAERYRPDAFHLDMLLNPDICVCQYCRPVLEKICGTKEITRQAIEEHWVDFINWRCECSASLLTEVTAILKEYGVLAAHNAFSPLYVPAINGLDEGWLKTLDVYVSECFDAFLSPSSDLNSTSINVRWQHSTGKPSWILRTSTLLHYGHWPISETQWQIAAAACKANGCKVFGPCGVGAYPDTTSAKKLLANVKKGLDFYMEDSDLSEGATPASRIGLVFSWATRKYFEPGVTPTRWVDELTGWARLLMEEHLPFDIVTAEEVSSPENLSKYDLVVLPNAANISDVFCNNIQAYVRAGGRILATAETSLRDEKGMRRSNFKLKNVLGVSWQESSEEHFAIEGNPEPEPASGKLQKVLTLGTTLAHLFTVDPAGSVSGGKDPLPMEITEWPVFTRNSYENGQAIYAAFDIGRYYAMHGDQHIGTWMTNLINSILPVRQIEVKAPRTVEVTVWKQPIFNRTIIHLANRTVPWTLPTNNRQITEIIPVTDIELSLKMSCANPTVSSRNAEITVKADAEELNITVARLESYAAIIIEVKEE